MPKKVKQASKNETNNKTLILNGFNKYVSVGTQTTKRLDWLNEGKPSENKNLLVPCQWPFLRHINATQ